MSTSEQRGETQGMESGPRKKLKVLAQFLVFSLLGLALFILSRSAVARFPDFHLIVSSLVRSKRIPKVLLWSSSRERTDFGVGFGETIYRNLHCKFICENTASRSQLNTSDAVIFNVFHKYDNYWPLPATRSPHQKWVYFGRESPERSSTRDERLEDVFNWTMTYDRDSDVWSPYYTYNRREEAIPAKPVSFGGKKLAAWLVSNCKTFSKRENIYKKLSKYMSIDKFGRCNGKTCKSNREDCYSNLGSNYLFYLAWENSLCVDYITEKLWLSLSQGIVPIVYGGADYDQLLPPNSFINVASFKRAKDLADYVHYLSTNITAYQEYLQWNEHYEIVLSTNSTLWCRLCEKLHSEQDIPTITSLKLSQFWSKETKCQRPLLMS